MLEIVNYNEGEYEFPCLLVLGCFDGLHIGHAELLKKAKLQAKINGLDLGVMMFADGKGGKQVYSFEDRVALLEQYNVKFVLKIEFTNDFKNTKPLDFLQVIEDKLNVKAYMSGKDFRFGAGAKGKSSTLKNYGEDEENGVWYMPVKDVLSGGDKVSTSFIKSLIENGDISRASELLGRNFAVSGMVSETCGSQVKVLYPDNIVKLKEGGYSVKCTVGGNEYNGFAAVSDVLTIKLEDFGGNIDGQQIKTEFLSCESCATEETIAQPEPEQPAPAIEELAVADETTDTVITEEVSESVEPEPVEQELPAENIAEDSEFEEELDEEFEENTQSDATEEIENAAEPDETAIEVEEHSAENENDESYTNTEIAEEPAENAEEPCEENSEDFSQNESLAEETEADESYTLTETAEDVDEDIFAEEVSENTEEEFSAEGNETDEGQTLTEIAEEPAEEISAEINESIEAETQEEIAAEPVEEEISEESSEVATEDVPDDGEDNV